MKEKVTQRVFGGTHVGTGRASLYYAGTRVLLLLLLLLLMLLLLLLLLLMLLMQWQGPAEKGEVCPGAGVAHDAAAHSAVVLSSEDDPSEWKHAHPTERDAARHAGGA